MKKNFTCYLLTAVCMVLTFVFATSCSKEEMTTTITISDNTEFKVNPTDVNLGAVEGNSCSVIIYNGGKWNITDIPEWLNVSATSGDGSSYVTFKAASTNSGSTARSAQIKVSNAEKNITLKVTQIGDAVTDCKVRPEHVTTTTDGIAFDLSCESNVARYYRGYIEASRAGLLSTNEILAELETKFSRHLPNEDEVVDFNGLKSNTAYIVYTVGYDKDGKRGDLIATEIKTAAIKTNPACAWVGDITVSASSWNWKVTKSATCDRYYMMTATDKDVADASDVLKAWWIEDAVRNNKVTEYLNGGDWKKNRTGDFLYVWTRGITSNGEFEGVISHASTISNANAKAMSKSEDTHSVQSVDHSARKLSDGQFALYMSKK